VNQLPLTSIFNYRPEQLLVFIADNLLMVVVIFVILINQSLYAAQYFRGKLEEWNFLFEDYCNGNAQQCCDCNLKLGNFPLKA